LGDETASQEIARLRRKIEELENQLREHVVFETDGANTLAQGDEPLEVHVSGSRVGDEANVELTWREAFGAVLARILAPTSESYMRGGLDDLVRRKHPDLSFDRLSVSLWDFDRVKLQLCALGLIEPLSRQNEFGDEVIWRITPTGISKLGSIAGTKKPIALFLN
jgi:hypothetical protein